MNQPEAQILYLNKPKRFTLEEAREILPLVQDITRRAVEEATPAVLELQRVDLTEEERITHAHNLQKMANLWADEIKRLGAVPKGLWLVDFDSGAGYYCWRYDESEIGFYHGYEEGFSGRTPIQ